MITLKNIEKLSEIVKEVKNIEEKMIELDSLAKRALTSNLMLRIAIEDPNKKEKVVDADGSLISGDSTYFSWPVLSFNSIHYEKNTEIFKHELTDSTFLKLVQLLMESYKKQRELCIKELNALQQ